MSRELSIVMALYGKASYTKRYVRFFREEAPEHIRLILFDADNQAEFLNLSLGESIKRESIFMNGTPGTYVKSMNEMLSHVETDYVMLNDNDDFPSFPGLLGALEILELDESVEWVGGKIGHFFTDKWGQIVFQRDKTSRGSRTISEKLADKYQYEWYNVFRTTSLQKIFGEMARSSPTEWKHPEIFQTLYCSLLPGRYLEKYLYFREVMVKNSSDSLNRETGLHEDFCEATVKILSGAAHHKLDSAATKRLLLEWLLKYNDRRRMYPKLLVKSVLSHLGLLDLIDKHLARASKVSEIDFINTTRLIEKHVIHQVL